jgi:hypothetical protein
MPGEPGTRPHHVKARLVCRYAGTPTRWRLRLRSIKRARRGFLGGQEREGRTKISLSAAIEVRRLIPGIIDNSKARAHARTIAGWKSPEQPTTPVTTLHPDKGL